VLWAYELGHRVRLADRTSVDTAVFFHDYDEYQSVSIVAVPPPAFVGHVGNGVYGEIYGVETSVRFQATDWWRLAGAYSYARVFLHVEEGVNDTTTEGLFEADQPRHQASLRSMMYLTKRLHLDAWLRLVDDIKTPEADHRFDEIVELDLRVRWQVSESLHVELVGRNLLDQTHGEYGPSVLYRVDTTEVERSAYAQVTCSF
jgi:iron complex outermembrane receptor protein